MYGTQKPFWTYHFSPNPLRKVLYKDIPQTRKPLGGPWAPVGAAYCPLWALLPSVGPIALCGPSLILRDTLWIEYCTSFLFTALVPIPTQSWSPVTGESGSRVRPPP